MTSSHSPAITNSNRIVLLDALRGFALFGLFIVHMVEYFELYWYKQEPGWVHTLVFSVFGGKAYAIFALLFGASLFIVMEKQARRGVNYTARFTWRLVLLGILGYLHGIIYSGDILQVLAVLGLPLLLVYRLSTFKAFCVAAFFLLQVPSIIYLLVSLNTTDVVAEVPAYYGMMGTTFEALANGSFYDVVSNNALHGQLAKWAFMLESGRASNIIGFSILGMCLMRINALANTQYGIKKSVLLIATLLLVAWGIDNIVLGAIKESGLTRMDNIIATSIFGNYHNAVLTAVLVLAFIVLYQIKKCGGMLQRLAPCGRMSLTIYVMQSIVCVPLFYGYGLGWYATIGQVPALLIGLLFWAVQLVLAHYWMLRYHYGPLEWLWRSATLMRSDAPLLRFKTN